MKIPLQSELLNLEWKRHLFPRRREMGVDKTAGLRPAEELGCLRGWETFCLDSLNIVIVLSQQRERIWWNMSGFSRMWGLVFSG